MAVKFVFHIGLPKTATTTAQKNIFPKCESVGVKYLGLRQPRSTHQSEEYRAITKPLNCEVRGLDSAVSEARAVLEDLSKSEKRVILISEEMVCVDSPLSNWQEKLERLGVVLSGFDYKILVTIREPISASYSLYCELYPQVRKQHPDTMSFISYSNSARVFRYDELLPILFRHFVRDRVTFVPFEWLSEHAKFTDGVLSAIDCGDIKIGDLGEENVRSKQAEGYRVRPTRVADILAKWRNRPLVSNMLRVPLLNDLARLVNRRIQTINLPTQNTQIAYLTDEQRARVSKRMYTGNEQLREVCGIDYNQARPFN